ncbi:DNA mismatch repair protein MutT [Oscillospiraceae bacterium]|nr:DNA mismatch repair protein MutT [Oscillospiraceae bacterium]BDF75048.1 DNA mismatch repair protein MutT [Oscillospiraceae bacterium]
MEVFAKPAVGAIIEKEEQGVAYILLQRRQKAGGGETNGLFEVVGGKIREYENIFDALRREVWEETGLTVTEISGEERAERVSVGGATVISCEPFCVTQNLSGIYSLIINTFLCRAQGTPVHSTNETQDIHWARLDAVRELVEQHPEKLFPMDVIALKKYLDYKKRDKETEK